MYKPKVLDDLDKGVWVNAGARDCPEISELLLRSADLCHKLNLLSPTCIDEREDILHSLLGSFGCRLVINSPFKCDFGFNIHIGNNFVGNFNLVILDEVRVSIGDNVMIGPNCTLTTITHALDPHQRNDGVMSAKPITIGDNVWIASNVTVLPGVNIGANSVIGAGSVVTKSIPSNVLAAGVPCKVIRAISENDSVPVCK